MKKPLYLSMCLLLSHAWACESDAPAPRDAGPGLDGGDMRDAGGAGDAGRVVDEVADASEPDAGRLGAPEASTPDAGRTDAGERPDDAGTDGADGGASEADSGSLSCTTTRAAQLCIRGSQEAAGEQLIAGQPVMLQLRPEGCHSSACTVVEDASCRASLDGTTLTVEGSFCLRSEGMCSLPDCNGGKTADCSSGAGLAAGRYTATLGDLSVSFNVPSTLPLGGTCVGSPFGR